MPVSKDAPNPDERDFNSLDLPEFLMRALDSRCPDLQSLFFRFIEEIRLPWSQAISSGPGLPAAIVINQIFNDTVDLVYDLRAGRGRQAIRTTRSIFELLITYLDITRDHQAAYRYERHLSVIHQLQLETDLGLSLLPKKEAAVFQHRLRRAAADSKGEFDDAVRDYGRKFVSRWSQENLATRAQFHGFDDEYNFYRLASMPVHGAAGGALGTYLEKDREGNAARIHRLGFDLQLCPLSYLKGMQYFRTFIDLMSEVVVGLKTARLAQACSDLLDAWPDYRTAMIEIDRAVWPSTPSAPPHVILAIGRDGEHRWFIYDTHMEHLIDAIPPKKRDLHPKVRKAIAEVSETRREFSDEWMTLAFEDLMLEPNPAGRRHNPSEFLPIDRQRLAKPLTWNFGRSSA